MAERWCWEVGRRDDARIAHRLYRKRLFDGVYQLDEGAELKMGKSQEHKTHWSRALVTQAWADLAGEARLHKVVSDKGLWVFPALVIDPCWRRSPEEYSYGISPKNFISSLG